MTNRLRTVDDLRRALEALDARPVHVRRILTNWLAGRGADEVPRLRGRTPRRPARLEAGLGELMTELDRLVTEVHAAPDADGSCRRLLRLGSGRTVEAVDLPGSALCISTQVGCAVGCRFCRTGEDGLLQQLDALEILAQLAHARHSREVRRVVLMGWASRRTTSTPCWRRSPRWATRAVSRTSRSCSRRSATPATSRSWPRSG